MKSHSPRSILPRLSLVAALVTMGLLLGGCGSVFVPKHRILVDAITLPGTVKPTGLSYRLVAKPSVVAASRVQVPVVQACVDAALATQGMYEAPDNAAPDLFIEIGFGRETGARVDPAVRETYLQLSARSNPDRRVDISTGPEVWDVRVAVLGIAGALESAMPMLATVAATNLAADTRLESQVEIAQNDPTVESVRQTALKLLEARPPPAVPGRTAAPMPTATSLGGAPTTGPATR